MSGAAPPTGEAAGRGGAPYYAKYFILSTSSRASGQHLAAILRDGTTGAILSKRKTPGPRSRRFACHRAVSLIVAKLTAKKPQTKPGTRAR